MKIVKETVLNLWPQTHVRSTKGDRWLFAVSDEYLQEFDAKKALTSLKGQKGGNMRRKRQLERYNSYKEEIRFLAKKQGFVMPHGYFSIWFYIPFPKSWERYKKKCAEMAGKPHQSTPDWDNLTKALFDALMPRKSRTSGETGNDDRKVHCGAVFKVWCYPDNACIRVVEYDKDEFLSVFSV